MNTETLWALVNSPIVISLLASLVVVALNAIYARKPLWKQYEGTIASAIRFAEKAAPQGSKLDLALDFVLKVYEQRTGSTPTPTVASELKEAIQVAHANTDPELL